MANFTDAERAFADSPAGALAIACQRSKFEMGEAHRGPNARQWGDAEQAAAIRDLARDNARATVQSAAFLADSARQLPALKAAAETARQMRKAEMATAYQGGR